MSCTLTAVPYPASDTIVRFNALLNPEAQGVGSWGYYAGGGTGALAAQAAGGATPAPAEVRDLLGLMVYTQATAATAGVNVTLAAGAGSVAAGIVVTCSAYVRTSAPRQARMIVDWRNGSNANVGYTFGDLMAVGPGLFTRLTATGPAPAGATSYVATIQVGVTGAFLAAGERVYVAAPLGDSGNVLRPYFSGATPTAPGVLYSWSGTRHASTSFQTIRTPDPDLATTSTPDLVLDYAAPRESATVAHRPIGRPDPVHALGPLRTREGTLRLFYPTHAAAAACQRLHYDPVSGLTRRVMLRDIEDPEMDMYYVPRSVQVEPTSERTATQRWVVTVEYTEVYATGALY